MKNVAILAVGLMVLVALLADYLLKIAGDKINWANKYFWLGMILYSLTAFVWYFVLRHIKFSEANLFYSLLTVLASVAIGRFAFGEHLSLIEGIAVCTAIGSIVVLSRFG
jgi:drug/metabolite transporter (DMT)-like permease